MQIKQISLYGKNGQRRDVVFTTSKLNIITGASKTGKTSLLDIVEYCLGSKECDVAAGHIRNNVSWFSTLFQFDSSQVFIARKSPGLGAKSSVEAFLLVGEQLEIPTSSEIESNTTIESAVKFISSKIGLPEYKTEVPEGQTRTQINLSFKHSKYFLFQSQDEIANKKILFHRQAEQFIPQTIKDVLPYFLGATDDDRFSELEKLRLLKRDRSNKQKELRELESLKGEGLNKGYSLLAEAAQVGLYEGMTFSLSDSQLIEEFRKIIQWRPGDVEQDRASQPAINELDAQYQVLLEEKKIVNALLKETEDYQRAVRGYEEQGNEQELRLETLNLFEKIEKSESSVKDHILRSLRNLSENLTKTSRAKPDFTSRIFELKEKRSEMAKSIKKTQSIIESFQKMDDESN
jgi:hypothetical protein